MHDGAIVKLDAARAALAECRTVMEAKQIADVAEAARVYLERTNASVETVNRAAEIRTLAERQMGEFLKTMPKATGTAGAGRPSLGGSGRELPKSEPTLAEIGITKKESSRAQQLASIPKAEFSERVAVIKASGEIVSPGKVLAVDRKPATGAVPISRGLMIARTAINHLESIQLNDREAAVALALIHEWVTARIEKQKAHEQAA